MTWFLSAALVMTQTAPAGLFDWAEARIGNAAPTPTANMRRLRVTFNICSSLGKTDRAGRERVLSHSMESLRQQIMVCATVGVSRVKKVTGEVSRRVGIAVRTGGIALMPVRR